MSIISVPNATQNIEIKEIPEMSMIHQTESAMQNVINIATNEDLKLQEGSFMSEQKDPQEIPVESPIITRRNEQTFSRGFSNNSKEGPRVVDQTESTMNIKSFSNYESQRDSAKREHLMSPGVLIQDVSIPHINDNFVEGGSAEKEEKRGENDIDYEKEYYKTREELEKQSENHLFNQSHNSTMLMESMKDHHNSQLWGKHHQKMRKPSSVNSIRHRTCKSPCQGRSRTCSRVFLT